MQRYNISDYQYRKFCLFRRLKIMFYIKENSFYHLSTSFYHLYRYSLFFFRQYLPYILLIKDGAQGFQDALCTASGPLARSWDHIQGVCRARRLAYRAKYSKPYLNFSYFSYFSFQRLSTFLFIVVSYIFIYI